MGRGIRPVNLAGSDQAVRAQPCAYHGFTIRETSGSTAAIVVIYDNSTAATGPVLEEISLSPGESAREYYPGEGLRADAGIYVDIVSGSVSGSIRVS